MSFLPSEHLLVGCSQDASLRCADMDANYNSTLLRYAMDSGEPNYNGIQSEWAWEETASGSHGLVSARGSASDGNRRQALSFINTLRKCEGCQQRGTSFLTQMGLAVSKFRRTKPVCVDVIRSRSAGVIR